jgi:phosphatidylserine decarboxylase
LDHFSINIAKKVSITDLYAIQQFEDESIADFVGRWRGLINQLTYALPQTELIKLFTRACAKHISPTLQIQTFRTFDEAFTMARKLEIRALEEEKLRLRNKNPNF